MPEQFTYEDLRVVERWLITQIEHELTTSRAFHNPATVRVLGAKRDIVFAELEALNEAKTHEAIEKQEVKN